MASQFKGVQNAVCAGICACLSSVAGKLMFTGEQEKSPVGLLCDQLSTTLPLSGEQLYQIFRLLSFVLNIILTVFMMGFSAQAMLHLSTLTATVINVSANFVLTAALGWLIFNEHLSMQWMIGAQIIMLGVFLIIRGESGDNQTQKKKSV
ncbi:hypothetical protein AKO1_015425 [Acrasis kona]|uniref:Transmembrane protein 42 n=1 Tax=Acrasis kona TaxID=1008807 RepID=A0AAW2YKN2_9EUKA